MIEEKLNPSLYLNKNIEYTPLGNDITRSIDNDQARLKMYDKYFEQDEWDSDILRELCWGAIPKKYRAKCWKILFEYIPMFPGLEESTQTKKRNEYCNFKESVFKKNYK